MNWWTEFSSCQDYRGLLLTGTILKIHEIVKNFSKHFKTVEDIDTLFPHTLFFFFGGHANLITLRLFDSSPSKHKLLFE